MGCDQQTIERHGLRGPCEQILDDRFPSFAGDRPCRGSSVGPDRNDLCIDKAFDKSSDFVMARAKLLEDVLPKYRNVLNKPLESRRRLDEGIRLVKQC